MITSGLSSLYVYSAGITRLVTITIPRKKKKTESRIPLYSLSTILEKHYTPHLRPPSGTTPPEMIKNKQGLSHYRQGMTLKLKCPAKTKAVTEWEAIPTPNELSIVHLIIAFRGRLPRLFCPLSLIVITHEIPTQYNRHVNYPSWHWCYGQSNTRRSHVRDMCHWFPFFFFCFVALT